MFKKLLLLSALLTGALLAQNLAVTGTVSNADGTPLSGGVVTAVLTNAAGVSYDQLPYNPQTANIPVQQVSAILDATGTFSLGLESNSQVTGSQWTFTVCSPMANGQCASVTQAVTSNTSLSSSLTAAIASALNPNGKATNAYVSAHGGGGGFSISAWGDSLTAGNEDLQGDSYPNYLSLNYGINSYNFGIGGDTSTQLLTRFNAANNAYYRGVNIFWIGRNDVPTFTSTLSNIQAMVAQLPSYSKYVVLGVTTAENEPSGNANQIAIVNFNSVLAAAFPGHYIDILSLLVAQANPAIPPDTFDSANNIPPYSLRAVIFTGTITTAIADTSTCAFTLSSAFATYDVIHVDSEYILPLTISGNSVVTCTRGFGGSTPATHTSGTVAAVSDYKHLGAAGYLFVSQQLAKFFPLSPTGNVANIYSPGSNGSTALGLYTNNSVTTGSNNTAFGAYALQSVTTGGANVAIGDKAGAALTSSIQNVAIGHFALSLTSQGQNNVAVGSTALQNNFSGGNETAVGNGALAAAVPASINTGESVAVGASTLQGVTTGLQNTAVGKGAGYGGTVGNATTTGSDNTFVGYAANSGSATQHAFMTVIGANATCDVNNAICLGRNGATTATSDVVIETGNFTAAAGADTLPAAASYPQACTWITDAAATPTYLATASGGGAILARVCSNGSAWQYH